MADQPGGARGGKCTLRSARALRRRALPAPRHKEGTGPQLCTRGPVPVGREALRALGLLRVIAKSGSQEPPPPDQERLPLNPSP